LYPINKTLNRDNLEPARIRAILLKKTPLPWPNKGLSLNVVLGDGGGSILSLFYSAP
jgi:hypothetical protein